MEHFDRIISIGQDCGVGRALRTLKYKDASYPFDWSVSLLDFIIESFKNDFNNFNNVLDICSNIENEKKKPQINNKMYFYHDLYYSEIINNSKNKADFYEKYSRRIKRLLELLNSDLKILFIRKCPIDKIKDIEKLYYIIKNKYPKLKFKIMLINNINDKSNNENIIKIYKDIDCFLYNKNNSWGHRNKTKAENCVIQALSNINCKTFSQPKKRDNVYD